MGQGNGIPSETYTAYRNCVANVNTALGKSLQNPGGRNFKIECETQYNDWKYVLNPAAQAQIVGDLLFRDVQVNSHQLIGKTWTIYATDRRFCGIRQLKPQYLRNLPLELEPNEDSWGEARKMHAWRGRMLSPEATPTQPSPGPDPIEASREADYRAKMSQDRAGEGKDISLIAPDPLEPL